MVEYYMQLGSELDNESDVSLWVRVPVFDRRGERSRMVDYYMQLGSELHNQMV